MFFGIYCFFLSIWYPFFKCLSFLSYFEKWKLSKRFYFSSNKEPKIWIHCSSVGEAKGVIGFIIKEKKDLNYPLYITSTTPSGYQFLLDFILEKQWKNCFVGMLPYDLPTVVNRFIRLQNIKKVYLYEVELWPGMIYTVGKKKLQIEWIAARMTKNAEKKYQFLFKLMPFLLRNLTSISTVDQHYLLCLNKYTTTPITVGFDYKIFFYLQKNQRIWKDNGFLNFSKKITLGFLSLHYSELCQMETEIPLLMKKARLIFIPRYPQEFGKFQTFLSKYDIKEFNSNNMITHFWVKEFPMKYDFVSVCSHIFVGGSLVQKGGHNLIEPFLKGCFVFFGPFIEKQQWMAVQLIKIEAGIKIFTFTELLIFDRYRFSQKKKDKFIKNIENLKVL